MSMNWLHGLHHHADQPDQPQAMPVFEGQKLVVVGGSSGMGRQTAEDVVAAGGSAVIIGQDPGKVEETVQTLIRDGKAWGITADLADRDQVERVRQQLAAEHADATLLVNAAGLFIPTVGPFITITQSSSAMADVFLVIDGAAQSAGAILLVYGLTSPRTVLMRDNPIGRPMILPKPMLLGKDGAGVGLVGSF